jgi:hypothetical protein
MDILVIIADELSLEHIRIGKKGNNTNYGQDNIFVTFFHECYYWGYKVSKFGMGEKKEKVKREEGKGKRDWGMVIFAANFQWVNWMIQIIKT